MKKMTKYRDSSQQRVIKGKWNKQIKNYINMCV